MSATQDPQRIAVKARYGFADWGGKTRGDVSGFIANFLLPPTAIEGWVRENREEVAPFFRGKRTTRLTYTTAASRAAERVLITVTECDSVLDSHESLIDTVMTYMAPSLPKCETLGLEIGDVCFGCHGDLQVAVIFARYNLLVGVDSIGANPIKVNPIALDIDSFLTGEPAATGKPGGPTATLSLSSQSVGVDGEVILTVATTDPAGREVMTKIQATGGTLSRSKDQYIYRATQRGSHMVSLFVVNEDGLVSKDARGITVS
jgi:hypothetical protein